MKYAALLWMDLEMTGLDPEKDRILEVAAIATDWDFQEIATFEAAVHVDETIMQRRMVGDFWEKYSDTRAALFMQNKTAKPSAQVEAELLEFLAQHFSRDERVVLAGNSIHQDRKFIAHEWRALEKKLHYRMLDVSAWKIILEGKYQTRFMKPEAHRALSDIRGSIEELEYYLKGMSKHVDA